MRNLFKKLLQQLLFHKSFNLYISWREYFYEVELVWNVFPKLNTVMPHFCVLLQKLLSLICFHILHLHPLCEKPLPKTMLQISVKLEYPLTSRPHLKISENEKHIALIFCFTGEFFSFLSYGLGRGCKFHQKRFYTSHFRKCLYSECLQ